MKPSFQTSPDQSDLSLLEVYISVTVPNHLRTILKPFLRLNPHVDHCPLYTVYWDHCLYDVWTTVQRLLQEIHRITTTQALPAFCCPLHLTLSIYRVWTAFNTWPKVPTVCWVSLLFTQSPLVNLTSSVVHVTLTEITQDRPFYTARDVSYPGWTILAEESILASLMGRLLLIRCTLRLVMNTLNVSNIIGKIRKK